MLAFLVTILTEEQFQHYTEDELGQLRLGKPYSRNK